MVTTGNFRHGETLLGLATALGGKDIVHNADSVVFHYGDTQMVGLISEDNDCLQVWVCLAGVSWIS